MMFNKLIISWYRKNQRELPWRLNNDPYSIWLSEIILQQTQVVQGLPYYEKFISKYSKVTDLADAKEEEVLKLWQGLGYYSRARNLHFAAKQVVSEFNGKFPQTHKDLLKLKGVGDYTAAAIASIAYKEVVPTVDGNVLRVISRVFDVDTPVDTNEGKKLIKNLMNELIDCKQPGDFNQAVMELGATICKPKQPGCQICPIQVKCLSFEKQNFLQRPVKSKKTKVKDVYIDYLFLHNPKGIIIEQRDNKGIWKSLYEFPNITSKKEFADKTHLEKLRNKYSQKNEEILFVKSTKHKLTHRNLHIRFFKYEIENNSQLVSFNDLENKAVPKPIEIFLEEVIKENSNTTR